MIIVALTPEDSEEILNYFKRRVQQYDGDAGIAYEHTVRNMITNQGYEVRDIKKLFGQNAKDLIPLGFNPASISLADEYVRKLQKVPLPIYIG